MKTKKAVLAAGAGAVTLLLAACGGGGGGSSASPAASPELKVSGTAATGAALPNAAVSLKCATGSGTGTTGADGSYSVTVSGGALPCMVEVKGTAGGASLLLHSYAESGTLEAGTQRTTAVAQVTPVTEMVVAQFTGDLPANAFSAFQGQAPTADQLRAAATAILAALKNAGIDLGGVDPFTSALVAAAGGTQGNAYDQQLDALGAALPPAALPLLVNQIAAAGHTDGGVAAAMTAVSGGSLAGCPSAVSGSYRTLDHFGRLVTRSINFKAMKFQAGNGTDWLDITPDTTQACAFTASGTAGGKSSELSVVMGPDGVGAYRARYTNPDSAGTVGYIFPAQSFSYPAFQGSWTFLQSGSSYGSLGQFLGQVTLGADGKGSACAYDLGGGDCVPAPDNVLTATERTDGGIDLTSSTATSDADVVTMYAYRAPNGSVALFGTMNASGSDTSPSQLSLVGAKLGALPLPAVSSVTRYWDVSLSVSNGVTTSAAPAANATTVTQVDAATGTVQRTRASDGRPDVVHYNQPLPGLRTRDAGSWNGTNFAQATQFTLPGMGLTVSVNTVPVGSVSAYFSTLSVTRP